MNEGIYGDFAPVYKEGNFSKLSEHMVEFLPDILERFDVSPEKILDLACGEGTFSVEMAKKGYDVTGVDISDRMLKFSKEKASEENVDVEFIQGDMRDFSLDDEFELATCWGDSLNYILEKEELEQVFENVYETLGEGGLFIFDMNTLYRMKEEWTSPAMVSQDSPDTFEIHRNEFDEETNITEMTITAFLREEELWRKIEEVHHERGYEMEEIRDAFEKAGFEELAAWENPKEMENVEEDSGRVWFVLRR